MVYHNELVINMHSTGLIPGGSCCLTKIYERFMLCAPISYTPCPRKKEATLIFDTTSPSAEIFLQFLKWREVYQLGST